MTVPVWVLLGLAAWTLLLLTGSIGVYRWSRIFTGRATVREWRADEPQGGEWYRRAMRARMNGVENLPEYAAIVVAAIHARGCCRGGVGLKPDPRDGRAVRPRCRDRWRSTPRAGRAPAPQHVNRSSAGRLHPGSASAIRRWVGLQPDSGTPRRDRPPASLARMPDRDVEHRVQTRLNRLPPSPRGPARASAVPGAARRTASWGT